MVRASIFAYRPKEEIMEEFGIDAEQYKYIAEPYLRDRAAMLIKNLSALPEDIPAPIRVALNKLTIISLIAPKIHPPKSADDLILLEKIENCAIKGKLLDKATWEDSTLDPEAIEVSVDWVCIVEESSLDEMAKLAGVIRDKIQLKEYISEAKQYSDDTLRKCNEMNIEPNGMSAKEIDELYHAWEKIVRSKS